MFKVFMGMFTSSFLEQVIVVFTRWEMSSKSVKKRQTITGKTDDQRAQAYLNQLKSQLKLPKAPEYLIINAFYDPLNDIEKDQFDSAMASLYQRLQRSPNIPTLNVEKVKTENMELKQKLDKYQKEREQINKDIKEKAQKLKDQKVRDEQARIEREANLRAINERMRKLQEERNRRSDARGPEANAHADSRGIRAEASVGHAWAGDPTFGVGAKGPSASAGISDRGVEVSI